MKSKVMGAAGLLGAFVAGMVVATTLGAGTVGQAQQVIVQKVVTPDLPPKN